jgi:parallel beta-helix repeat protein
MNGIQKSLLLILSAALVQCSIKSQPIPDRQHIAEGLIIYKNIDKTEVSGRVSGHIYFSGNNAAEVFQSSIDKLANEGGGKLEIERGTYVIDKPILLKSNISVEGSGRATILKLGPQNAKAEGIILLSEAQENILIADLTLTGEKSDTTSSGVVFDATGLSTVRGVYARDFSGYGIWLRNHSFACKLENNLTSGNDIAGSFISHTDKGRGGRFVPNKIIGCYSFAEDGDGFLFLRAICQDVVGNVAYLAKGNGIAMYKSTSNLVSGNRIFMCQKNGILIKSTFEMNISSNICGWNWGDNLVLDHCVWGTVTANEFIDAGGREREGYGIYMKRGTKSMQISGNAIFNWWDNKALTGGIYEGEDCLENQITDNIVNYYKEFDVKSLGKNSIAAYNLGLPHPYGSPGEGPDVPNVLPEDIKLNLHINESRTLAEEYLKSINKQ